MDWKEKNTELKTLGDQKQLDDIQKQEDGKIKEDVAGKDLLLQPGKESDKTNGHQDNKSEQDKSLEAKKVATAEEIREKAKSIHAVIPTSVYSKGTNIKLTKAQKKAETKRELDEAKDKIRELHSLLDSDEKRVYGKAAGNVIDRKKYAALKPDEIKKRAEMAIKRKKNAAAIEKFEAARALAKSADNEDIRIDKETLRAKITAFMKMRSEPYDMGSDEKFTANLDKNYKLCDGAELMKRYIDAAVDGGYMPKVEDMAALQTKIATFAEVRLYLDTQKALMKNPYYQYMAKDDISYTDSQLERLGNKASNKTLQEYMKLVLNIRSLNYVRRKGISSVKKHAQAAGKKAAEILRTKNDKRALIEKFSDIALNFDGNKRFVDEDYDSRFTPELLQSSIERFKAVNINDLHFYSLQDVADHYDENMYLFNQAHDVEHLIMVAIQRGMAPSDDELIKLRAKIETFTLAERMVAQAQKRVLSESDKLINEQTYEEFENNVFRDGKSYTDGAGRMEPPYFGCNLKDYLRNLTKKYKQEHKDRKKTIRLVYGLTHGVNKNVTDKDGYVFTQLENAEIPAKELEKREKEFQKNLFCSEYMRNTDVYIQDIGGAYNRAVFEAYSKKTGRKKEVDFGRSLGPFLCGRSSREIIEAIDIMQTGTEEQKDRLWTQMAEEAFRVNHNEWVTRDPKVIFRNAAYKARMIKIFANLGNPGSDFLNYIKDPEMIKKVKIHYQAGCAFSGALGNFCKISKSSEIGGYGYENLFDIDSDNINELIDVLNSDDLDASVKVRVCGTDYKLSQNQANALWVGLGDLDTIKTANTRFIGRDFPNEVRDCASRIMYEEFKLGEAVKPLTDKDLSDITVSYNEVKTEYEKAGGKELADIKKLIDSRDDGKNLLQKVVEIEKVFKKILEFDLGNFEFSSYRDIYSSTKDNGKRAEKCMEIAMLAKEGEYFLENYKRFKNVIKRNLSNTHLDEIAARCELISRAGVFFDPKFIDLMNSAEFKKSELCFDDIIHLAPEELDRNIEESREYKDDAMVNFWTTVKGFVDGLGGFDIRLPLGNFESEVRHKRGMLYSSRVQETINMIDDAPSVLGDMAVNDVSFLCMTEKDFKAQFNTILKERELTVSERDARLDNTKSRLHVKFNNRNTLNKTGKQVGNRLGAAKNSISLKNRAAVGEKDLNLLCAFMEESNEGNNALVVSYTDKNKSRDEVLDKITRKLMGMNINISAVSDADFAAASDSLELISIRARAYEKLLEANPDYKKRLMIRNSISMESDYEKVMKKLNKMLAISDYYRARRVLMLNPHYILHYNDEMVYDRDKTVTDTQRRTADLINLVAICTRRLNGTDYRSRQDAGMERLLAKIETFSLQEAFLRSRPDLTKADPSAAHKAGKEIARYFKDIEKNEYSSNIHDICATDDEVPYPKSEKYKTKAVKRHIDAIKYNARLNYDFKDKVLPHDRMDLYNKLNGMIKAENVGAINYPEYKDPVTGEVLIFHTNLERLLALLCSIYGYHMPDEDIAGVVEGFTLPHRKDIDLSDEKIRLYVRERFLESMKAVFKMEFTHMKRYQNTYGSLGDELPLGVFMESLGDGQKDFAIRSLFGQDLANLCDAGSERCCKSDGKNMTAGEILVKYGKLSQGWLDNAILMCPEYYQKVNTGQLDRFKNQDQFIDDSEESQTDSVKAEYIKHVRKCQYQRDNNSIGGPRLSRGKLREIWKKTLDYSDDISVTGGEEYIKYNKIKLNLLSSSEKKRLKKERQTDAQIFEKYNNVLNERQEALIGEVKKEIGEGISDELLRELIPFHPRMLRFDDTDAGDIEKYIDNVKKYAGIGVREDEKEKAKKEASDHLFNEWDKQFRGGATADSIDMMMNGDETDNHANQARENPDKIMEKSRLYRGEVRHRMFESIKSLANTPEYGFSIDENKLVEMRKKIKEQISFEIFRAVMTSRYYLDLKDVGSMNRSYPERMYQNIIVYADDMREGTYNIYDAFLDKDFRDNLEYFGIRTDDLEVFMPPVVKEKQTEIEAEAVKEEKKVEQANPVKEAQKEEKKEEKVEPEKEEKKEEKIEPEKEEKIKEKSEPEKEEKKEEKIEAEKEEKKEEKIEPEKEEKKEEKPEPEKEEKKEEKIEPEKEEKKEEKIEPEKEVKKEAEKEEKAEIVKEAKEDKNKEPVKEEVKNESVKTEQKTGQKSEPVSDIPLLKVENCISSVNVPGLDDIYEDQDTNNCYCCVGTTLINQFISRRKGEKKIKKRYDQYDMRKYEATFKKINPAALASEDNLEAVYYAKGSDISECCGKGKTETGNLFEIGDYILEKLEKNGIKNVQLNMMRFNLPLKNRSENEKTITNNIKAEFTKKIKEVLDSGNVVGLLRSEINFKHYYTVVGLDGDMLTVYDSSPYKGKATVIELDKFLKQGSTLEINYLTSSAPAELVKEYPELKYDEKSGFDYAIEPSLYDQILYIGLNNGVTVMREGEKIGGKEYTNMLRAVYVRNPLKKVDTLTLKQFEKMKDAYEKKS